MSLKLTGECKQCGACCKTDINWMMFDTEERKQDILEFVKARGYDVIQIGRDVIQVEYPHACASLDEDNRCARQLRKPRLCRGFPANQELGLYTDHGLDVRKILPPGCGYRFVEVND